MRSNISLNNYLSDLINTVSDYSETGLIAFSEIVSDARSDKIGLIKGKIVFIDESILFFKEYLDLRYRIEKKAYSFHYQDVNSELLFRYDNALHKPDLGFSEHKHVSGKIIAVEAPVTRDVLEEIVNEYFE